MINAAHTKAEKEKATYYDEFVEKFKPKLTTDDCITPPLVYEAVKDWAVREYGLEGARIVRPFWPGADYKNEDYSGNCVVIDNPPFSILAEIKKFYNENGIRFFLFAPNLTLFGPPDGMTNYVLAVCDVVYENGAIIRTSFLTNMGDVYIRTAPELTRAVEQANRESGVRNPKKFPKYKYPANVISSALMGKLKFVDLRINRNECHFIRSLDCQRAQKKSIFGGGFLLSDNVAAEIRAAEIRAAEEATEWELSPRERDIIRGLGEHREGPK